MSFPAPAVLSLLDFLSVSFLCLLICLFINRLYVHAQTEKIAEAVAIVKEHNPKATVITTPLDQLDAKAVLDAIEGNDSIDVLLAEMMEKAK